MVDLTGNTEETLTIGRASVMVIEDDAMVRSILVDYLKSFGFVRIQAPEDSKSAVKMLLDHKMRVDLILSDWHMPAVDGIDILRLVRKLPVRTETKFIMITSQVAEEREKVARARAEGVDAYIVKPFKGQVLRDKIWAVLGW